MNRAGLGLALLAAAAVLRRLDHARRHARRREALARATAREAHPSAVGRSARGRHHNPTE